jgi:S-adenosylmethionine:tRNA ribosyltransferase-isomerase
VRLLVSSHAELRHAHFTELPELLSPGDLLVVNTSRTIPAALPARRADGSTVTINLSTPVPFEDDGRWVVELRREGARVRDGGAGERLSLPGGARAKLLAPYMGSRLWVAALGGYTEGRNPAESLLEYLAEHGRPIRYGHLDRAWQLELYQNVYATEPGSVELPSAGRPLTAEIITRLIARGIDVAPLVLHTGVSSLERGEVPFPERYRVPQSTAERVNLARRLGGRVIAVGTTVVRALESATNENGRVGFASGWTNLIIGPERRVSAIDGLITGFHDRNSSHLNMLEAVAGRDLIERSYRAATESGYLRHEFGDLQLIDRETKGARDAHKDS